MPVNDTSISGVNCITAVLSHDTAAAAGAIQDHHYRQHDATALEQLQVLSHTHHSHIQSRGLGFKGLASAQLAQLAQEHS